MRLLLQKVQKSDRFGSWSRTRSRSDPAIPEAQFWDIAVILGSLAKLQLVEKADVRAFALAISSNEQNRAESDSSCSRQNHVDS